ncbi:hypothetical protein Chor_011029 [Crotalus horridus]
MFCLCVQWLSALIERQYIRSRTQTRSGLLRCEHNDMEDIMYIEVILKRAADLVEALYGMPHNNQVNAALFMDK